MATSSNLSSIIRFYSEKTKSPFIDFKEFCNYIKKYAEHHIEEKEELVKYIDTPNNTVAAEIQGLSEKHIVSMISSNGNKTIVYIAFFTRKISERYNEIKNDSSIPYPIISDLPEKFPTQALEHKDAVQYISSIIDKEEKLDDPYPFLYIIDFAKDIPALLLPSTVSIKIILETAQQKILRILKKDEYHDYFLKKLRNTNPTREVSIRAFYTNFVDREMYKFKEFSDGDDYYIWNQTLYYISQDFSKIQDRTVEDINNLQACQLLEIYSSYLKEKFQREQERKEALKKLETSLRKSPYFFTMHQILKFQDENGRLLYGQYLEDDFKEFLKKETTETSYKELPSIIVFKVSGKKYYMYKDYIISVTERFCNEAHISIEREIEDCWYESLKNFEYLPEMNRQENFEDRLQEFVEKESPILYALLNSNFMTIMALNNRDKVSEEFNLFADGHLLSYSELLMMNRAKILSNAKLRLPFYYTIPGLSWIIGFFHKLMKHTPKKQDNKIKKEMHKEENKNDTDNASKQKTISSISEEITKELVPEGSTIDRELDYLLKQWNIMLSKDAYTNLTEDVNSLIRDYLRHIMRTLSAGTFSKERVENLAKTLVNTPALKKIPDKKALSEYIVLYILRLLSNM